MEISKQFREILGAMFLFVAAMPLATAEPVLANHPRVVEAARLLEVWLDAEIAYERIPGMSIAVVHDQELVWTRGFGYADVERRVPATPKTVFRAGSIVKLFTATGVMQLRDEGKLGLDDPVRNHLPWFGVKNPFPEAGPIAIADLLTHSSGFPRDLPAPYWTGPDYPFPTHDEFIAAVAELTITQPRRTKSQYSNPGMTLAGEVVSSVSGRPFDDVIERRIFEPLGMADTCIDTPHDRLGGRLAAGYSVMQRDGTRQIVPPYEVRGLAPAAGLISTAEDLARFASWQFRALEGDDGGVLERNTLRSMHQIQWMQPDGWSRSGYGYQTWAENDRTFVGHAGAVPGYESKLLLRPQEKFAVVVMTNCQGPDVDGYAQRIYDLMAPAIRAVSKNPRESAKADDSKSVLAALTGVYRRPYGGESAVIEWQGGLAVVRLPAGNPLRSMDEYERVADDTFRRAGTSGVTADLIRFERDADGRMRMRRDDQYSFRNP
jgi:CubicO group peptidase (beta-lactamase class C family)